jgi:hypothetical protein
MRSALGTAGGALVALGLLGCHAPVKRPPQIDGRGIALPPPRADAAAANPKTETAARDGSGGTGIATAPGGTPGPGVPTKP